MVKYIKFGRIAVAYDDTRREERTTSVPPTSPPPTSSAPPPANKAAGSGWVAFGKVMAVIVVLVVLLVVAITPNAPPGPNASDTVGDAAPTADRATPQGVCERGDVQVLVGKEARKIILDQARSRILMLAMFGLIDPQEMRQQFENADVTFTGIRSGKSAEGQIACLGSMRFDDSNVAAGQDIMQLPALSWRVAFADGDGNLASTNFTVDVDRASVFEGMMINGKPADEYLQNQRNAAAEQAQDEAVQAKPAPENAAPARDNAPAAEKIDALAAENTKSSQPPSNEDLYAPH